MKYLLIFLSFVVCVADAQTRSGVLLDENTKLPLAGVAVYNRTSKVLYTSEINGAYAIKAEAGDTVIFTIRGYALEKRTGALLAVSGNIALTPLSYKLDEVVIESPYVRYSRDSANERLIYEKTIKDAAQKPKFDNGIFTWLANHISGRAKKYRHFVQDIRSDEQARYISILYNPEKVIALTHASDSMAQQFIVQTPMPYDFARTASALEVNMWIREHYRQFIKPRQLVSSRPSKE